MNRFVREELARTYRVASAFDGEEGLSRARALTPDVVVSDVMMPRLDGVGLVRALRADPALAAVPVILLTALADEASLLAGLEGGADDYLAKPFSRRELQARVGARLERIEMRRALILREAEAIEFRRSLTARDEFLSVASHELRTPLTSLQLNLQLLARELDVDDAARPRLETSIRACKQLAALVETLLDVGRAATGHLDLERVDLDMNALLRDLTGRFESELAAAHCPLDLRLAARPATGRWDKVRLEQVLSNLLANAIKFGAGNPIEVECTCDTDAVHVTVADHGVGICPDDQARLFQRFERAASTRRYGGLGLGLWIAKEIVEGHAGTIRCESAEGHGARFLLDLPRVTAAASAPS